MLPLEREVTVMRFLASKTKPIKPKLTLRGFKRARGLLALLLLAAIGACGGGGTTPPPAASLAGTVLALQGGDIRDAYVYLCEPGDDGECFAEVHITQGGASAPFSFEEVPGGQYEIWAWQDLNGSTAPDEGDAFGCHGQSEQSCASVSAPKAGLTVQLQRVGGGNPGENPGGTPPGVTFLRPSDFTNGVASVTLPKLGAGERVAVIPVHASQDLNQAGLEYSLSVSGVAGQAAELGAQGAAELQTEGEDEHLHDEHLERLAEGQALAQRLLDAGVQPLSQGDLRTQAYDTCPAPQLGQQCGFWINAGGEQMPVTATVQHVSENAYWFVQNEDLADFSQSELQALAQTFEEVVVPTDTRYFGSFSDVDQNGKIVIVFSHLLAPAGVYGYVSPVDFFPDAEAFPQLGVHSNEGDIFYAATPGSLDLPRDAYMQALMPATMVHELKHLIATGTRLTAGKALEELWIEEGSAQAAQELAQLGDSQGYAAYALAAPEAYRVVYGERPDGEAGQGIYGYNFLFLWRVAEKVGHDVFWKAWTAGPTSGVANLEAHTGEAFPELMLDWATTLMFDHTGKLEGYDYQGINLRDGSWEPLGYGALGNLSGTAGSMAYFVGKGTGEDVTVSVRSSGAAYVAVVRFTGDLPWGARSGGEEPTGDTLSGTVYAPPGGDVAGTVMLACNETDCPVSVAVNGSGASAPYQLSGVPAGEHLVFAWQDLNGSGELDDGDGFGCYSAGSKCAPVTAPATRVDVSMGVSAGLQPSGLGGLSSPQPLVLRASGSFVASFATRLPAR